MNLRVPLLVLALALPLAGCFGDDGAPATRTVTATGGKVSAGWAYGGEGLAPGGATLDGFLSNPDNAGSVNVTFEHDGAAYVVAFDRFAQASGKDFMDGGVAFGLDEHGDTGVADTSIPKIHATIAAWGQASVTRNGAPLVGKAGDLWSAHLMVSRDTVRGADGRILKADGATPYDPNTPADALRVENDPQAIFWIKSPDGETAARPVVQVSGNLTCAGPQCVQTLSIPTEAGAESLTLNLTFASAQDPLPAAAGEATVTLRDAGGNATQTTSATLTPGQQATMGFQVSGADISGPFTLELTGAGAFTARVSGEIVYADKPFLVVTWDEVTVA